MNPEEEEEYEEQQSEFFMNSQTPPGFKVPWGAAASVEGGSMSFGQTTAPVFPSYGVSAAAAAEYTDQVNSDQADISSDEFGTDSREMVVGSGVGEECSSPNNLQPESGKSLMTRKKIRIISISLIF